MRMKTTDAILTVKRLSTPMKLVGIGLLAHHCATADVRFNPIWVAVYVGVAVLIANVCVAGEFVINKVTPTKKHRRFEVTPAEQRCIGNMDAQCRRLRRNPLMFLLIAGEDGFFFLPLLYAGISPATAIAASAIFTLMHYRDKPNTALVGTFLFTATNVLIVLPHGILPMILGHYVLDATAYSMAPLLKKWLEADQRKMENAQPATAPYSEPAARPPQG